MKNILTIIRKELHTYFNYPTAYILMVVFLSISYFFYFKPILITGETTMRPLFSILPWLLMFFVPAITMGLIAKEKESGTIEILVTQTIRPIEIILGKAIGAFLFTTIVVLMTLSIPLTLSQVGSFDWGLILSQYIGGTLLIAGFVAIGMWASSITKNQIISFITAITLNFLFIFIGFEMIILSLPYPLNLIFKELSILKHFDNIARGVLDLRDIIYFISLIIVFIFLSYLAFLKIKGGKTKIYKKFSNLIIVIIIIALVVNLSGNFIQGRIDLTQGKIFTLAPATKNIIANLQMDLTINLFVSKQLPAQIESQAQDVEDMLADYTTRSNGRIKLNIYHPDVDASAKILAQQQGIPPVQFNIIAENEFKAKQGYLGITINKNKPVATNSSVETTQGQVSADKSLEKIPFIKDTNNLEYQLTAFIWKLTKHETKKIAWLTGHGEKDLLQNFSIVGNELAKQYKVDTFSLTDINKTVKNKTVYKNIPADVALLIIAGPTTKLANAESSKINNYLKAGGSVLVLANQIVTNPQFMTATSTASNLGSILGSYGITVDKSLVYDLKSNETITLSGGTTNYILSYPLWVKAIKSSENNILGNINTIVLPWASPITISDSKLPVTVKIIKLFETTKFAGEQQNIFDINPQHQLSQNDLEKKTLAVAVENKLNNGLARLLVVGNVNFADDNFLKNAPTNMVFILNSIEWLVQDDILASIRAKNLAKAPLLFKSNKQKDEIKYFNILGIPLLIIIAGVWVFWKRKKITQKEFKIDD